MDHMPWKYPEAEVVRMIEQRAAFERLMTMAARAEALLLAARKALERAPAALTKGEMFEGAPLLVEMHVLDYVDVARCGQVGPFWVTNDVTMVEQHESADECIVRPKRVILKYTTIQGEPVTEIPLGGLRSKGATMEWGEFVRMMKRIAATRGECLDETPFTIPKDMTVPKLGVDGVWVL